MPEPAPRWRGGIEFMIPARLGEENMPMPMPSSTRMDAKAQ